MWMPHVINDAVLLSTDGATHLFKIGDKEVILAGKDLDYHNPVKLEVGVTYTLEMAPWRASKLGL